MSKSRWTPERRAKAADAIRQWRPWERSTGPRTEAGKATAAQNARKHGLRDAQSRELLRLVRVMLAEHREGLERL